MIQSSQRNCRKVMYKVWSRQLDNEPVRSGRIKWLTNDDWLCFLCGFTERVLRFERRCCKKWSKWEENWLKESFYERFEFMCFYTNFTSLIAVVFFKDKCFRMWPSSLPLILKYAIINGWWSPWLTIGVASKRSSPFSYCIVMFSKLFDNFVCIQLLNAFVKLIWIHPSKSAVVWVVCRRCDSSDLKEIRIKSFQNHVLFSFKFNFFNLPILKSCRINRDCTGIWWRKIFRQLPFEYMQFTQ